MENIQNISDISKETLTFLAFFDNKMIEKIPSYIIAKLCEEAADSDLNFYVDTNKSFREQEISEKTKDLISLIYYDYIAEENEKKEILKQWNLNEEKLEEAKAQKYSIEDLFKRNKLQQEDLKETKQIQEQALVEYKESFFIKIINRIKKIFYKN